MRQLLAGALCVWGLEGTVSLEIGGDGAARLRGANGVEVKVRAGASEPEQRWRVRVRRPARDGAPGRERTTHHAGVPGLLRTVRAALAPEQRPGRMIVAPTPGAG